MRLRFVWVGKTRDAHVRALVEEYLKRLVHFVRFEISEVREGTQKTEREGIEVEGRRIKDALRADSFVVLLDLEGRAWSSTELATEVERWQVTGTKEVAFVIGGPSGVADEVKKRADVRWSLSRLTLTHEMARVILVEQVYRAYTIIHGLPYQK